jgi:putative peptidoglycan lipid II flippase
MTVSGLFNIKIQTIAFAAGVLILSTLLSRVLGVVRNGLLSWQFGAGETTDIYLAAFRIPDLLYGIFIMGGVGAVFLPVFSEVFQRNEKRAWEFVNNTMNVLVVFLLGLSALAFLFAPFLIHAITPGFSEAQKEATVGLTRLMLLSPIFFGLSSVLSGVLQYFGKFVAYSIAPLVYNIGIIVGIVLLVPLFGIWGLGLGVIVGALLHAAVQVPAALSSGLRWKPLFQWKEQTLQHVFRLALPRTIAAVGFHINIIAMMAFASLVSVGSVTLFTFANDIQQFSIGLIGGSFAVAAFPALSKLFAEKKQAQFQQEFEKTLRHILFLVTPVVVLTFLLRAQIVRLIYGAGDKFLWEDTRLTAAMLGVFAFGIVFQACIPFFTRTFFAVQNTKIPAIVSLGSVAFNIGFAFWLLQVLSGNGALRTFLVHVLKLEGIEQVHIMALPLALVITGAIQLLVLAAMLRRYVGRMFTKSLFVSAVKTGVASCALAAATYGVLQVYGGMVALTTYVHVAAQFLLALVGGGIAYIATAFLLRSAEVVSFWNMVKAKIYGR